MAETFIDCSGFADPGSVDDVLDWLVKAYNGQEVRLRNCPPSRAPAVRSPQAVIPSEVATGVAQAIKRIAVDLFSSQERHEVMEMKARLFDNGATESGLNGEVRHKVERGASIIATKDRYGNGANDPTFFGLNMDSGPFGKARAMEDEVGVEATMKGRGSATIHGQVNNGTPRVDNAYIHGGDFKGDIPSFGGVKLHGGDFDRMTSPDGGFTRTVYRPFGVINLIGDLFTMMRGKPLSGEKYWASGKQVTEEERARLEQPKRRK